MSITKCFIASAGFGTRMGDVGKILPKPLWPIFNMRILDLQLQYLRELGIDEVYMNTHHHSKELKKWSKEKNVTVLEEEILLGSGGCIHNLMEKYSINEKILIINADQFLFFDKKELTVVVNEVIESNADACLFAISVDASLGYNETVVANNVLNEINKTPQRNKYLTYSGVGVLDLEKIKFKKGVSGFFESVCNYKNSKVLMKEFAKYEYWDFGTTQRYIESLRGCFQNNSMSRFLGRNNVVIPEPSQCIEMLNGGFRVQLFDEEKIEYQGEVSFP